MRLSLAVLLVAAAYVPPTPCAAQTPAPPAPVAPSQNELIKLFRIDADPAKIIAPVRGESSTSLAMSSRQATFDCSGGGVGGNVEDLLAPGLEKKARSLALEQIRHKAACAVSLALLNPDEAEEYLSQYSISVGITLGYSMLLSSPPDKDKIKQRALAYLAFAKAHGNSMAGLYIEQFQRNSAAPSARANEAAEYALEARDAAAMFQSNQMAFHKKYGGRTIEVSGEMIRVWGSSIELMGIPPKSADHSAIVISCNMSDPAEIAKLDNIMPGMSIKVRGLYFIKWKSIELAACRVVSSSTPSLGAQQTPE